MSSDSKIILKLVRESSKTTAKETEFSSEQKIEECCEVVDRDKSDVENSLWRSEIHLNNNSSGFNVPGTSGQLILHENIKRSNSSDSILSFQNNDDDSVRNPNDESGKKFQSDRSSQNSREIIVVNDDTRKRKRIADPCDWLQNKAKILRNSGQSYVSTSRSKKVISARKIRAPCSDKCRFKCSSGINNEQRNKIFQKYWDLKDITRQRDFISRSIKTITPTYRYTKTVLGRRLNSAFYFEIREQPVRVCKNFFKSTLDINDRPIRTAIEKNEIGFICEDLRGKCKPDKIDPQIKYGIRKHIESIPRIESHYLRNQTTKEFIDGGKTVSDLFRDYKNDCIAKGLEHTNNRVMYSRILHKEYNISFFTPKKDQCELCVAFKNAEGLEKERLLEKYKNHQKEKELSRKSKEEDKEKVSSAYIVAVYDLQAVLPTPRGNVSTFYYKSKLNSYNFTIYEMKTDVTECYLWHEGEGNRGAEEIASCVLKYIYKKAAAAAKTNTIVDLVFFSDNCCGQQKNQFVVAMYLYAVMTLPNIKSITHKFLITGHTQNEGDCVHSTIEKQIKRSLTSGPIYVPSQYAQIIRLAKKNGRPYNVNELSHSDFYAIKALSTQMGVNLKSIKISDVKILKIEKPHETKLFYKTSFTDTEFRETEILYKKQKKLPIIQSLYKSSIKIKENKKKDLLSMLTSNHIPQYYSSFYNSLK